MGLYLCIFDGDEDIEGVDVGAYSDFDFFRSVITEELEGGQSGAKYPTLVLHSDCDGEWSIPECVGLEKELEEIAGSLQKRPPRPFNAEWQRAVAKSQGLKPASLLECFMDVDGEPLVKRLALLCRTAQEHGLPISFQ
jgi:hypothetical protein